MKKYLSKYEYRWAFIFILLSLLWSAFEFEMGWHDARIVDHKYYTFLFLIPFGLCFLLFLLDKRSNRYKKKFRFQHAFYSGLGLTILITLFSIPTQLFIHYFMVPDYVYNAREFAVESGEMTIEQAKARFNVFNFVVFYPIMYFFGGIVLSYILAHVLRRTKYSGFKKRR